MGASVSVADKIQPKDFEISENSNTENESGISRTRNTTDIVCLLLHALVLVILIPLLLYCIYNGNIYRIINGYDSCLNVCGKDNYLATDEHLSCNAGNMKERPYLLVFRPDGRNFYRALNLKDESNGTKLTVPNVLNNTIQRACLKNCSYFSNHHALLNRCVLDKGKTVSDTFLGKTGINDFFEEVSEDFELCWQEILYLCIIALAFSCIIMILLRILVAIVVWLVLIGVALACIIGSIYLWVIWKQSRNAIEQPDHLVGEIETRKTQTYLAFAIIATIVTVCVILIILVMRKRVQLVIQLFKEAGKAISSMPLILFQPILTFTSIAITVGCWIYFTLWIESSGHAKQLREDFYFFEKDFWMRLTRWYNIFVTLWLVQFVIGCQHMIIAGAISTWYFTRNKNQLESPIFYGFYNLTRYHLGSVSFGSLLIAVVQFLRICLTILQKYLKTHDGKCVDCAVKCCQCCLLCLEKFVKFLTRNAYIEIAIHGYSFYKAGKRAFKILSANALRVATINSVGDFVLFLGKVLVIMATVLVGVELIQKKEGILHSWVPLTLSGLFAYLISHCFLSVYEMSIDTIFICFCEDCEGNDGISRPYFMSHGLMEFVENSKNLILKSPSRGRAWQNNKPATIS